MDVSDRSSYSPSVEALSLNAPSRSGADGRSSATADGLPWEGDSSKVSVTARSVSEALQAPEIRQDRISELQQQIASGNYQVAPEDVASAMLRDGRG